MEIDSPIFKSSNRKSAITTLATTPRMPQPIPKAENPQIMQHPRYKSLFQQIQKDKQKTLKYDKEFQAQKLREKVKQSVYDHLRRKEVQKNFVNKFAFRKTNYRVPTDEALQNQSARKQSINSVRNRRKTSLSHQMNVTARFTNKNIEPYTIFLRNEARTDMIKDQEQMRLYLADLENTNYFQFECRLRQYYLDILSKKRSNVQYLDELQKTSQHRRLFNKSKDIRSFYTQNMAFPTEQNPDSLVKMNLEDLYKKSKKRIFVTKDQLTEFAGKRARQNVTYRKKKNYQLIDYIMEVGFKNLQNQKQYQHDQEKETNFNKRTRFFVSLAFCCQPIRVYYDYIAQNNFPKLHQYILQANPSIKQKQLQNFVSIIVQNKKTPLIRFQDFNQYIQRINQQYDCDILSLLEKKNPQIFDKYLNLSEQEQNTRKEIQKKTEEDRFKLIFNRVIFQQKKNKIILDKFLQIRPIIEALKKYQIVPKIVSQEGIIYCLMENIKRREGLSIEEVVISFVNYAMKTQNWKEVFASIKDSILNPKFISR